MEKLKEYLITLLRTKNIENIVDSNNQDSTTNELLSFIGRYSNSSTNDCYMYLNEASFAPISYEDVDSRIQNLIDLGLIQNVKNIEKKSNENSIEAGESGSPITREKSKQYEYIKYYSISSAGIFYLFSTSHGDVDVILENKEDGLFLNFLYPNLSFDTLQEIEHFRTTVHITRLLNQCCETIRQVLKTIRRIEEKGGDIYEIGYVEGLADPEANDCFHGPRRFILGLKENTKIEWLDLDETKIVEIEKNKLFKIYDEEKENELLLEICPEKNVAVLLDYKNDKIREFHLEKDILAHTIEDYAITSFNAITVEDYIDELFAKDNFYFYPDMFKYDEEFYDSMLEYMNNEYLVMDKDERGIKGQDCIAIAKDKNFQELARTSKQKMDSYHDNFIRLSQIN